MGEIPAWYYPLCHVTEVDTKVFCIDVFNCALLDLANLTTTPLPSLPSKFQMGLSLDRAKTAAVGRKVFFFRTTDKEYLPCLDLAKRKWTVCKGYATSSLWSTQTWTVMSLCVVSVDSAIFMLCNMYGKAGKYCNKLLCYDTEKDIWSKRANLPFCIMYTGWKFVVAINKDIYCVCEKYKEWVAVKHYNTMEDKWTAVANSQLDTCYFAANINGMLALGGYKQIRLYNRASNTWESHQVELPEDVGEIDMKCVIMSLLPWLTITL